LSVRLSGKDGKNRESVFSSSGRAYDFYVEDPEFQSPAVPLFLFLSFSFISLFVFYFVFFWAQTLKKKLQGLTSEAVFIPLSWLIFKAFCPSYCGSRFISQAFLVTKPFDRCFVSIWA
jgi:hypothetical protein